MSQASPRKWFELLNVRRNPKPIGEANATRYDLLILLRFVPSHSHPFQFWTSWRLESDRYCALGATTVIHVFIGDCCFVALPSLSRFSMRCICPKSHAKPSRAGSDIADVSVTKAPSLTRAFIADPLNKPKHLIWKDIVGSLLVSPFGPSRFHFTINLTFYGGLWEAWTWYC